MNRTTLAQYPVEQEDTGTVPLNFKRILFLNEFLSYFSITDLKMASYPVDIGGSNKKRRPRQPIAAEAGAVITKRSVYGCLRCRRCSLHKVLKITFSPTLFIIG